MAQINNLSPDVVASYEKQIAALKEVLKAQQAVASDQSQLDQLNAEKKAADQAVSDWKSAANSIEQGITMYGHGIADIRRGLPRKCLAGDGIEYSVTLE